MLSNDLLLLLFVYELCLKCSCVCMQQLLVNECVMLDEITQ